MADIKTTLCIRTVTLGGAVAVALLVALMPSTASAQPGESSIQAITTFENATRDYARMHRRLERQIGPIEFGTPIPEINRIMRELAAAIRAERGNARQGALFTPAVVHVLRARISDALLDHDYTADDVRAAGRTDGVDYRRVKLTVNDTFPWLLAATMFPCVLEALPALPPELQYRFVGDDLVLVDVHASLVVDILPQALIDFTVGYPPPQHGGQ